MKQRAGMVTGIVFTVVLSLAVTPNVAVAAAIHDAAAKGDLDTVREILEKEPEAIAAVDEDGRTPLHWACRGNFPALVAFLVEHDATVDALDNYGSTPLHNLAYRNLAPSIRLLLKHHPKLDIQNHERSTALHYAAIADASEAAALLVEAGASLELTEERGRTALILCARERGGVTTAQVLISAGAKVNAVDRYGDTALDLAAWRGKEGLVDLLLDAGAQIPSEPEDVRRALSEAASHGLKRLFSAVANTQKVLDFKFPDGGTLLDRAAAGGSVDIVDGLLKRGLDPKHTDRYGWTPLHYAARDNRSACAKLLLAKGAHLSARNLMGQTACSVAEERGSEEVAELLRGENGACPPDQFPVLKGKYLGQEPPGKEPQPFAIGIVSSIWGLHSSVSFSRQGDVALWAPMVEVPGKIYSQGGVMMSERVRGQWTAPHWAPFTGPVDGDVPFFAPDGGRIYFISTQPVEKATGGARERIWFSDRNGGGWTEPQPVDAVVNDVPQHWQFAVAADHDIYFSSDLPGGQGGGDLYVAERREGEWVKPVNLGAPINTPADEATPYVAPDGTYLLFQREGDLFLSHRQVDGGWTEPHNLGEPINSPKRELCPLVSPDGKYLFFLSMRDGGRHVWWVSTEGFLGESPSP